MDAIRTAGIPYMAASSPHPSKKSIACESVNVCNCCRAHNTGSSNDINVANGPVISELLCVIPKLSHDLAAITDSLADNSSLRKKVVQLRKEVSEIHTCTVIQPRPYSHSASASGTIALAVTYASTVAQTSRTTVLPVPVLDPVRNQKSHVSLPEHAPPSSAHSAPENTVTKQHPTMPPQAAREQSQSDESWSLVHNRRKRSSAQKPSDGLKGRAPMKRAVFYIGNIDLECTADVLVNHCVQGGVKVATCRIFPSRKAFGTASARISIDEKRTEKLLSDDYFLK